MRVCKAGAVVEPATWRNGRSRRGANDTGKAAGVRHASPECGRAPLWSARHLADRERACVSVENGVSFMNSSRSRPLKLSMNAFCMGLPGAM